MNQSFYEIAVADSSAKKEAVFTYAATEKLQIGQVVTISFKKDIRLGIVWQQTAKPKFKVKMITAAHSYVIKPDKLSLLRWLFSYYPFQAGDNVKLFLPQSLTTRNKDILLSPTIINLPAFNDFTPTKEQQAVLQDVQRRPPASAIVFGETGTGKTFLYALLARSWLEAGKSVILLAPEITLSEHLYQDMSKFFKNIVLVHSLLTSAERNLIWKKLSTSSQPVLVLGPRSALFSPLSDIGGIIIDEAHDGSYKQQQSPYYHALRVGAYLAQQAKAHFIYGTATPNVADYYLATVRSSPIYRLSERPVKTHASAPILHLMSTKKRENFTTHPMLSNQVIAAVKEAIRNDEQSLLLLNRRGTAQLISCDDCGWQYMCANCDHSLVYHKDIHKAVCHFCGQNYTMPSQCPECGHDISLKQMGTKYLAEIAARLFGENRVVRIDADAVDRNNLAAITQDLRAGKKQVVIGTQIIAKGLDLPKLRNVILVDAARQANDYLGEERFYQLIHQVIGRATRGHRQTAIYLQTAHTDDSVISQALHQDWQSFYSRELAERKKFGYPPFKHIALFSFKKRTLGGITSSSDSFIKAIQKSGLRVKVIGPMPAAVERVNGQLAWQCLIKSSRRLDLLKAAACAPSDWTIDFEPLTV